MKFFLCVITLLFLLGTAMGFALGDTKIQQGQQLFSFEPIPLLKCNYSTVVRAFTSQLNANATLTEMVFQSINQSSAHGPNSKAPWNVRDLMNIMNDYLTFIPTAAGRSAFHYLWEIGDIFDAGMWEHDSSALSFLKEFVVARGQFLYSHETAGIIASWIATYPQQIKMYEFVVPSNGYSSFGEFFTRNINMTYRPVTSAKNALASPIDGNFENAVADVGFTRSFKVKGAMPLDVTMLLGGNKKAEYFIGGPGTILMLNAYNYHKWHAPLNGVVDEVAFLGGMYYGVKGELWYPNFGYHYHRVAVFLNCTDEVTGAPFRVVMVPVGISEVGSVIPYVSVGQTVKKGELIGAFDYGGSAVFLAFEKGVTANFTIPSGNDIQVGQSIGSVSKN